MTKKEGSDNLTNVDKKEENLSAFSDSEYTRGEHPNSLKNLKPFPKGVSGNPLGKPLKYENLKRVLNEYGDGETTDWRGKAEGTRRQQVWERIWKQAIAGDIKYVQFLAYLGCLDER